MERPVTHPALRDATAILPEGQFLDRDILHPISILPMLIHVQHENVSLYLPDVSVAATVAVSFRSAARAAGVLTSISTKLGVGSSASGHQPVVMAPVALPGLTKNLPSIS